MKVFQILSQKRFRNQDKELTKEEIDFNKQFSKERIKVEHVLAR